MAKLSFKKGTTSKLVRLFIQDSSKSDGSGLTGLAYNAAGLIAYYIKEGDSSATAITLASMALGTWASGGFVEADATHLPGLYELGIPNAAITGANSVVIMLKGATNMVPVLLEVQLEAVDNQDTVRGGMTALPNIAAGNVGAVATGNASGYVTVATNNDKTGYSLSAGEHTAIAGDVLDAAASGHATAGTIGAKIGVIPASPAAVGSAMTLDLTQVVPTSNTNQTVGDALNAARAQGFGKWTLSGTTLTLYAPDGTTAVRTFTLDSSSAPTSRT